MKKKTLYAAGLLICICLVSPSRENSCTYNNQNPASEKLSQEIIQQQLQRMQSEEFLIEMSSPVVLCLLEEI